MTAENIMSRFKREISGTLGKYWQESAEKEVIRLVERAQKETVVDEEGAIYWTNTRAFLEDDLCEKLEYANYKFSRLATTNKREEQTAAYIKMFLK